MGDVPPFPLGANKKGLDGRTNTLGLGLTLALRRRCEKLLHQLLDYLKIVCDANFGGLRKHSTGTNAS